MTGDKGRTALVTGATDGVGRVVARELARQGWRVLVHGRDRGRGEALVREIEKAGGSAIFLAADLASLAEVRRLADEVRRQTDRLDLLINNAGIGTAGNAPGRQTSADGHELRFAVNYLAGFLLTHLLLPLLKAAAQERGGARIVNVASAGQQAIDFSDVMLTRHYSGVAAYCQSKLAQILFTVDLADELKGYGRDRQCAASLDLHEHDHGPPIGHAADEQGRGRRRGDPAARRLARARGQERALLQRPARGARQPAGLRRRGAAPPARAQPGADRAERIGLLESISRGPAARPGTRGIGCLRIVDPSPCPPDRSTNAPITVELARLTPDHNASQIYVSTSVELSKMLDRAEDPRVSIGWLMEQLGRRSFGLTLFVMAVIAFLPGASPVVGLLMAWPAVQMMLGQEVAVLPRLIARRKIGVDRLARVVRIVTPRLAWVERLIRPRWPAPFQVAKRLTGIVMLLLGLTLISPVPFSHVVPALVIMLLALAYLEEDGIALLVALIAALASLAITAATVWGTVETIDWLDPARSGASP